MSYIAKAITEKFGERCKTFDGWCETCQVWAGYHAIKEDIDRIEQENKELNDLLKLSGKISAALMDELITFQDEKKRRNKSYKELMGSLKKLISERR